MSHQVSTQDLRTADTVPPSVPRPEDQKSPKDHGRAHGAKKGVPVCLCKALGRRSEAFDAYHCPVSGVWLEVKCDEEDCLYCSNRPETVEISASAKDRADWYEFNLEIVLTHLDDEVVTLMGYPGMDILVKDAKVNVPREGVVLLQDIRVSQTHILYDTETYQDLSPIDAFELSGELIARCRNIPPLTRHTPVQVKLSVIELPDFVESFTFRLTLSGPRLPD